MLTFKNWFVISLWLIAAFLVAVFNFIEVNPTLRLYYSDILQNIAALLACYYCFKTAFCFPKENIMRVVWQLFGLGMLAWGIGAVIASIYLALNQGESVPYPYYSDIGYLLMIVCFIFGLIFFKFKSGISTPVWGNLLGFVALVLGYFFAFVLEGFSGEGMGLIVSASYMILDPLLFSLAVLVFASLFGAYVGVAWWYMVIGISLYFAADQLYAYFEYNDAYEVSSNISILWDIGFLFIAISAMYAHNQFAGDTD